MPLLAIALAATLALVLPGEALASSTERSRWRRPLPASAVAGSFSFDPAAPYERGRRRGIDFRGRPGAAVVSACSGRVTHAGVVPAWGAGVTLRCGALVATELGLGTVAVRRGTVVLAGAEVGRLGGRGVLRLGARHAGVRHGYVDPELLLGRERPWAAPPAGRWRSERGRRLAPPLRRAGRADGAAASATAGVPMVAWAGLALVASGAAGTGVVVRRRRASRGIEPAAAHR